MSIKKSIIMRVRLAFLAVALFAMCIIVKMADIQVREGKKWSARGEEIGLKVMPVKATRGNIYSDNGSLLATSVPYYRLAFDPTVTPDVIFNRDIDSLSLLLSRFFGDYSKDYYKQKIKNARTGNPPRRYMLLNKKMIGYQDKKEITQWPIFRLGRMKGGVIFEKVEKRIRPFSYLGSRTIGYINEENYGAGLEYSFNTKLAGQNGQAVYQKIAGGNLKPIFSDGEVRSQPGYDIETTLDVNLQDVAESALLKALLEHDADYGSVVVMEVKTGEIKAISNLSKDSKGQYKERYNYAVASQGVQEPGSTFKLVSMLALFEETPLKLDDVIPTGNGEYQFYGTTMRDHKPGGYGDVTVKDAFAYSSNIAVAKMVTNQFENDKMGYYEYLEDLGLTKPLGFHMIGEGKPYVKAPSDSTWSGITLPWMSHGYELKLSPLQTLTLYNAVANKGKMIRPIIVKNIRQADEIIEEYKTTVVNQKICSDETLAKLHEMLVAVVDYGTAKNIRDSHYKIAGKTGTAQKLINGRYTNRYYTSFVGYFPADAPRYSCIVVIDNPKGYKQYGSDVAAPVFKEIADLVYSLDLEIHDEIPEDYERETGVFPVIRAGQGEELQMICDELGIKNEFKEYSDWVKTRTKGDTVQWMPNKVAGETIPDVRGMTLRDALYILENKGLQVTIKGRGRVNEQSLLPGTRLQPNANIVISLS